MSFHETVFIFQVLGYMFQVVECKFQDVGFILQDVECKLTLIA